MMFYFHSTLFLKDEKFRQILHHRFGAKMKILSKLLVLKIGSCEHTTNDLPKFSPQIQNLEIGPSAHAYFQFSEPKSDP